MTVRNHRIEWVDALKGFTIICVVLGHIINGYVSAGVFPEYKTFMRQIVNGIYLFHMPLFMILSGFTYATSYIGGRIPESSINNNSVRNKTIDLTALYIIHSLLFGAAKLFFSGYVNREISTSDLLLLWAKPIQLFWYIYVLILLYLIFSIGRIRNSSPKKMLIILCGLSVVSGLAPTISWFQISRFLFYMFFFYFGVFLQQFPNASDRLKRRYAGGTAAVSTALIVLFWNDKRMISSIPIICFFVAFGASFVLLYLFRRIRRLYECRVFLLSGRHSLEIYLLHTYIFTFNRKIFLNLGITDFCTNVALNLTLSVLLPILIAQGLRRIHCYDLFFRPTAYLQQMRIFS